MNLYNNHQEFVKKYTIAYKLKWSRQNFAQYMGMTTDSVRRKTGKIKDSIGFQLPPLELTSSPLTKGMIEEFNKEYRKNEVAELGEVKSSRKYLITAAQNATPVHSGFLTSCLNYCKETGAEFIVIPYRYRNPSSLLSNIVKGDEWWADNIKEYLVDNKILLCDNLTVLGNVKIQPTANDPLSGFEGFSGMNSNIIGHPKIQFRSVPTLNGKPKILATTGAITVPNYTDSKAGHKGNFHHSIGAMVVEVDEDGTFHVRHVHASDKNGSFYDLDSHYSPKGVTYGHRVEALITGDTHAEFIDEMVENATFHDDDSIVNILRPKKVFLHDVLDFYARNHHHRGNDIISYGKHKSGRNNVQEGLQQAADFIDRISRRDMTVYVVKSNHDEAFDRWLREADVKSDPENSDFYYYMKYHQMKSIKMSDTGFSSFDPFKFWCHNPENGIGLAHKDTTVFLARDQSVKVCSVELGFHGDVGINGSRGDIKSLAKLSDKMVVGHSHTPGIYEGCYQVGLSAKTNLEYKKGPSSWMQTHCIIYPDGKRTLINIVNGKWKNETS